MSFDLNQLSEEAITGEIPLEAIQPSKRPTTVLQSLVSWEQQDKSSFTEMIGDVLGPQYAQVWANQPVGESVFSALLDVIRKTNTVRDLSSPIEVYIDPQHQHSLYIYDDNNSRYANDAQTLKNDMKSFLINKYKGSVENPEEEAEIAIYWYSASYHDGQWSPLYSILSTSPYKPGKW